MDQSNAPQPSRGASLLLIAAIFALALNLRPAMAAVGPLLDLIEAATGMGSTTASLLTTLPVAMIGVGALSIRPLRRRLGERKGVLLGAVLIGLACLARAAFDGTAGLIASAVAVGVGVALIQALAPVVVKRAFPTRFGTVMGVYTTGIMGGAAVAAATAAGLAEAVGWAGALALWAVPAFLAAVVWIVASRAPAAEEPNRAAIAEGTHPELPFWKQPRAWALVPILGLGTSAYTLVLAWLPPYYVDMGQTRATAGFLLSGMTGAEVLAGVLVSLFIARFPDRRGPMLTAVALALVGLAGLVLTPVSLAVPIMLLLGLGIGAVFPLTLILAMDQIDDPVRSGDLLAFVQGGGYIIASLSPLVAGLLRDHMADLTGAWVLMGVGVVVLGVMTLQFRLGLPKLR
ncbi:MULTISPECIES: MFS transporter [Brevundimonas]|uniref:MFS transporter n=1 Tax=Brevundimonas TaxID=41275 RepID=UPI00069B7EB1|nr:MULTISPECIES: MFS transporter [Brevundimonas]MBD3817969.1 MFS transporter [Brevundimonas diminuta]OMG60783.1 MFS transporter [Brevundimonas sp. ZS04]